MSTSSRSDSDDSTLDVDELIRFGARSGQLTEDKVLLEESHSQSFDLIKRLEVHVKGLTEAHCDDKKQIQGLERQLLKCYKEIDYLRDQLNLRDDEADSLDEHGSGLELKLADMRFLQEEVTTLREELKISNSERLLLKQELAGKEAEIQKHKLHIDELEDSLSSSSLESQCEIESMQLEMIVIEQSCLEAEKREEEHIQEKAEMKKLIDKLRLQIEDSECTIDVLQTENKGLRAMLKSSATDTQSHCTRVEKHFEGSSEERHYDIEKMSRQICEYESLVEFLKQELREQKWKAKEEGEDLAQEMAELRYQMTELLEDERQRRACIEMASLQRIAELEAQIQMGDQQSSLQRANTRK
ncbi:hypothetical protein AKJ16_DCAP01037 [Drosera capensis]